MEMIEDIVRMFVSFGPTIIFLVILLFGVLFGLIRGFRKSLILAIHALVAFLICLIAYLVIVNNPSTDYKIVSFVNSFAGDGYIQNSLDVSGESQSLKEILVEYIPKNMDFGDGMELVLKENGAYLGSLVNLVYHIIFAIIFSIVYLILIFVFYIIYVIFYPERRYRRKRIRKEASLATDKPYKKRPLLGIAIGGTRGLISGLVCMSFIGSLFFVLAGGLGESEGSEDYDFGTEDMNVVHSIYQSVGSYGTTGIFKILNTVKDSNDVPYYLYAADLVFSGGYKDSETGLESNIALTHELKVYTEFSRRTFDLVLKFDDEGVVKKIVLGEDSDLDIMTEITKIMSKEGFQEEFGVIIDDFDGGTYFIDLSLSLVDSIVRHIDELTFSEDLGADTVELLNILFKPGYKSQYIPEDQDVETPAYINASNILTKTDAKTLVKTAVSLLASNNTEDDEVKVLLSYANDVMPTITELSIFGEERKESINPLLQRVYSYITNRYLVAEEEEPQVQLASLTKELKSNDQPVIDWVSEIHSLLDLASNALTLVDNVYTPVPEGEELDIIELVFSVFDEQNEKYESNQTAYTNIKNSLTNSSLLSLVLSDTGLYEMIEQSILDLTPEAYLPDNINYINKLNSNGEVEEYGEVYNLLTAVERVLKDKDAKEVALKFVSDDFDVNNTTELLNTISDVIDILYKEVNNETIIDCVLKSKVVMSVASGFIIGNKTIDENMNLTLYIPDASLEEINGTKVNLLKKDEILLVLDNIPTLFDAIIPCINENESGEIEFSDINGLVSRLTEKNGDNDAIDTLLESDIVEGTLVNVLSGLLTTSAEGFITMPEEYVNPDGTTNIGLWLENQEVSKVVHGIAKSGLDFDAFLEMGNMDATEQQDMIFTQIRKLADSENNAEAGQGPVSTLLDSLVLHYSFSGIIMNADLGEFNIIIPADAMDKGNSNLIAKDQLTSVIKVIPDLLDAVEPYLDSEDVDNYNKINPLIQRLTTEKNNSTVVDSLTQNLIIEYTLIDVIGNLLADESMSEFITLPEGYAENGEVIHDKWHADKEISNIVHSIAKSELDFDSLMNGTDENQMLNMITDLSNKEENVLLSILDSKILHFTISGLLNKEYGGFEIIVPYSSIDETISGENIKAIEAEQIVEVIKNLPLILPEDLESEIDVNKVLKDVVDNCDQLLSSPILLTTVVNYMNANFFETILASNEMFSVPEDLKSTGNKEVLIWYPYTGEDSQDINPWENEAPNLIKAIDVVLGITSSEELNFEDEDFINNQVIANVKSLNNNYKNTNDTTNLDVAYGSRIIRATLTKTLDNAFIKNENPIADNDSIESIKTSEKINDSVEDIFYPQTEVSSLVNSINELDLDVTNIVISDVVDKITEFNGNSIVKPNENKTQLNVIYESDIIKYTLSYQLDKNLNALIGDDIDKLDVKESNKESGKKYYKETEISSLIESLNALGITGNNLSNSSLIEDNLKNEITNLNDKYIENDAVNPNDTKLDVLYSSEIIKATLSNELCKINQISVPADAYDTNYVEIKIINKIEFVSLVDAIDVLQIDLDSPNLTSIPLNDEVKDVVLDSKIIRATLTTQLKDMKDSGDKAIMLIPNAAVGEYGYITNSETSNLLDTLIENKDNLFTKDSTDESRYILTSLNVNNLTLDVMSDMTKSDILHATVIKNIVELQNDVIVVPQEYKAASAPSVSDTDIKAGDIVKDFKNNIWYTEGQVNKLVNGLGVFIGTNDSVTNIKAEDIKAQIKGLNTKNGDTTNLDIVYESIIIKASLTKQLDSSLTDSIVDSDVKDYVKTDGYYNIDELRGLIDSLNILAIDIEGDAINIDNVTSKVSILNESYGTTGLTNLGAIYQSYMMRHILSDQLDSTLTTMVAEDVRMYNMESVVENHYYYKLSEVSALVNAIGPNGINMDFNSISNSAIQSAISDLNEGKLNVLYGSNIITQIIHNELDNALVTAALVEAEVANEAKETHFIYNATTYLRYTESQVLALINTLNELDIDLDTFDEESIKGSILNLNSVSKTDVERTKLDVLYDSVIVTRIIAKQLDTALTDADVSQAVVEYSYDSSLTINNIYNIYKELEIIRLINGLNALGITNIDAMSTISYNILLSDNLDLATMYQSEIIVDVLTQKLSTVFTEDSFLKDHPNSKYISDNSGCSFYKQLELESLIEILKSDTSITDITAFDVTSITLTSDLVDNCIGNSYILMKTLTSHLIANVENFIIPVEAYDFGQEGDADDIIEKSELIAVLKSITNGMGDTSLSGFDAESIVPSNITNKEELTSSLIMRANITYNINVENKSHLYVSEADIESETTNYSDNSSVVILTQDEIINVINAFNTITNGASFTIELSIETLASLTVEQLDLIFKSSVMLEMVSEYLIDGFSYSSNAIKYAEYLTTVATITYQNNGVDVTYNLVQSNLAGVYKFQAPQSKELFDLKSSSTINTTSLTKEDIIAFLVHIKQTVGLA